MTEYVCTRWYRAPEVLCSWTDYTAAIDVWSVGCIFGEMLGRRALFPGHNTQHQLQLIIELLGSPSDKELMKIPNEKCRKFIKSIPDHKGKELSQVFPEATVEAVDLLTCMLRFDPEERIQVNAALMHGYLSQLHCPEDEPTRAPLETLEFEFERRKITEEALREELFAETLMYYPELLQRYIDEQASHGSRHDITKYRLLEPGESQYSDEEDDN